jgi:DNA repair exonuclease SbcCD nuclease subunit
MPQGRDINEAGAKSVTLVTVRDDRSVVIEERTTSLAQFERVRVDLTGVADWRGALARIEHALGAERDRAPSEHLVARLSIVGATPLAFRLRRDRDLLREEAERRAEAVGKTWIDRVALDLPAYAEPTREDGADPLAELGALMRAGAREDEGLRAELRALVKDLRDDLPAEARGFTGDDESALDAFLDRLAAEGAEEALARLAARATQEG